MTDSDWIIAGMAGFASLQVVIVIRAYAMYLLAARTDELREVLLDHGEDIAREVAKALAGSGAEKVRLQTPAGTLTILVDKEKPHA